MQLTPDANGAVRKPARTRRRAVPLLAALSLFALPGTGWCQAAAVITHLSGTLTVKRVDGSSKLLSVKSEVFEGDTLLTQQETFARLKFTDGAEIVLRPESQLRVTAYSYNAEKPEKDSFVTSLVKGGFRAVTGLLGQRNREKVSVNSAVATIGIRGTHFGSLLCNNDCGGVPTVSGRPPDNGLHVDVVDGAISVTNSGGSQNFAAGQFGYVRDASTAPVQVPAEAGIRVTMPSSISSNRGGGRGVGQGDGAECSVQ